MLKRVTINESLARYQPYPLHYFAACNNHSELERLLKAPNATVDSLVSETKQTPLHVAVYHGRTAIVKLLVRNRAQLRLQDSAGKTPLHYAASNKHDLAIMQALLPDQAAVAPTPIDLQDNHGETALHLAVKHNYIDGVRALINAGANINAYNNQGYTPLHYAFIQHNDDAIAALLARSELEINARDANGKTALHLAIENIANEKNENEEGLLDIIDRLLAHRADIEATDHTGKRPLHYAAELDRSHHIISSLLRHAALLDAKDMYGTTAVETAKNANNTFALKQFHAHAVDEFKQSIAALGKVHPITEHYDLVQLIAAEASTLNTDKCTMAELTIHTHTLKLVAELTNDPRSSSKIDMLFENIHYLSGHAHAKKRLVGGLLAFAGLTIMASAAVLSLATGGTSAPLTLYAAQVGALVTLAGLEMIYHYREKGLAQYSRLFAEKIADAHDALTEDHDAIRRPH